MSVVRDRSSRFAKAQGGAVALIFALALPALALITCGAIDLAALSRDRAAAQDSADQAALAAAAQLGLIDAKGVDAIARRYVHASLTASDGKMRFRVSTQINQKKREVTVRVKGRRDSFFGIFQPPGGWRMNVSSTAGAMGLVPLCVLSTGKLAKDMVEIKDRAHVTAVGCMIHSNGDIKVDGQAWLQASLVQAAGRATGRISPSPQQGAPEIPDPFSTAAVETPKSPCIPLDVILGIGVSIYPPGVHCGDFKVPKGATLRLLPGDHYFIGKLELTENAVLHGQDVVLIFDKKSDFKFKDQSNVDLTGRTSGAFAGFVLGTTRKNTSTFEISSDSARRLYGTIYIPAATLEVTGEGISIADKSPWTVIVAKSIKMTGSPNLVLNSQYDGAVVPVPEGVGPSTGIKLTR